MRIIPIEIELDYWPKHHTARLLILHIDLPDFDTSLLDVGWYQGEFMWDVFFYTWIFWKTEDSLFYLSAREWLRQRIQRESIYYSFAHIWKLFADENTHFYRKKE